MNNKIKNESGDKKLGEQKVNMAFTEMIGIRNLLDKYKVSFPLKGISILGCVTPTPQTGALILAFSELGAKISWCSDNRFASDDDVITYLQSRGVAIFAKSNMSEEEYFECMRLAFLEVKNDRLIQIADDGCDIVRYLVKNQKDFLKRVSGITEQTTCGINALKKLYSSKQITIPAININDCFTKQWFDNYYGIQQSLVVAFSKIGISIPGKKIAIFGYGPVGKGAARVLQNLGATVSIVEKDLLMLTQAKWDGMNIADIREALSFSDMCITATGCIDTISGSIIQENAKDSLILGNIGHGTSEFDVTYLEKNAESELINEFVTKFTLNNGKSVYSLCTGALINFIAGGGNPSKVMSLTFTLVLLAQMGLAKEGNRYKEAQLYSLNRETELDSAALNDPEAARRIYELSNTQKIYLNLE